MTMFGLQEAVVAPLVAAVSSEDALGDVDERFARASWTGIAEPGDRLAGALVTAVGAGSALRAVIERWSVERVQAALLVPAEDGVLEILLEDLGGVGLGLGAHKFRGWGGKFPALTGSISIGDGLRGERTQALPAP